MKVKKLCAGPKPKTQVKSITTTTTKTKEIILKIQQQTSQKNTFVLGGVARKPQRFLGNVLNFIRTILRWGAVRTFPRLRLIWGRTKTTTTTKAASERGNFFLHAVFFCFCAWSSTGPASAPRSTSRSHGVVLLEDLFGSDGLFVPSVFRLLLIIRCFVSITSSHHRMHMPWPKVKAIVVPGIPLALPLPLPLLCLCLYLYSNFVSCCSFFITFLVVVVVAFCTWRRPQDLLSCGQRLLL